MQNPTRFTAGFRLLSHFRPASGLFPATVGLAACAWLGLSACKPVEIADPGTDSTVAVDSATVTIFNHIEQDPQAIVFYLFNGNAFDIVNANKVKRLGEIEEGQAKAVKVPVGTWKLAYETEAGVLIALESYDAEEVVWVKAVFEKDRDYALILATDGNRTVWSPTFATIPELEDWED